MKLSPAYVGTLLCRENGDLFLIRRIDTIWGNAQWNFPGGLIEEGESIIDAAVRETQEEVGAIVAPEDFRLTHVLDVHKGGTNDKSVYGFYFITHRWSGEASNKEPHKISDAQWFSPQALPEGITEHALLALEAIKNTTTYMQSGWPCYPASLSAMP